MGPTAAGIAGPCNPRQRTAGFWEAAAAGSWREVLVHGGHAQFCDISGGFERRALDLLCGRGNDTHEVCAATLCVCCVCVGGGGVMSLRLQCMWCRMDKY